MDEPIELFLDAGNRALDLLNTLSSAGGGPPDQLRSPDELRTWLGETGLDEAGGLMEALKSPPAARILLAEAHRLREDVSQAVEALASGRPLPEHVAYGINRVMEAGGVTTSLRLGPAGPRLEETERGNSPLALLVPVARAAAQLVVGADPTRLRRCASETCGRWFIDSSKGGRRKWCSMATCGNRAKAASHRRRHASA